MPVKFSLLFMFLVTALIVKTVIFWLQLSLSFFKKRPRPNLEGFQDQIWTSVERSGKWSSSKAYFSAFLQISCSNFMLKLCQMLKVMTIVKEIKFKGVWGELEARNCFQRQLSQNI